MTSDGHPVIPDDPSSKKQKLFVYMAQVFLAQPPTAIRPMPLGLDNGLPAIEAKFGTCEENEIVFRCHIDTCAAMNTGNLAIHQWIITNYPEIVSEYIQYDDAHPFDPIQLQCAVKDLEKAKQDHGMLTAIVRYKSRYLTGDGNPLIISFGLGSSVAVNAIIGLPTIKAWACIIDFTNDTMSSALLGLRFKLHSAPANAGLPSGVTFESTEFIRPLVAVMNSHNVTAPVDVTPSVTIKDNAVAIKTDS